MSDPPEQASLNAAIGRYVQPDRRPMGLLHGSLARRMSDPERAAFLRGLTADSERIGDQDLAALLTDGSGWRARLVAAWLIGISRRTEYRERIGELLIASRQVNAGQGYCFALACFATQADAEILSEYLDHYLRRADLRHNQGWAIAALLDVDAQLGSDHAAAFTGAGGLWQQWSGEDPEFLNDRRLGLATLRTLVEQSREAGSSGDLGSKDVNLPPAWIRIAAGSGTEFEAELAKELTANHPLANRPAVAVAHCGYRKHVLFEIIEDPRRWAHVVLTRSSTPQSHRPFWGMFASFETAAASIRVHKEKCGPLG